MTNQTNQTNQTNMPTSSSKKTPGSDQAKASKHATSVSVLDQCPTTVKGEKQQPNKAARMALAASAGHAAGMVNGNRVWRSMDDLADTSEFREFLEREFPAGAGELDRAEAYDDASDDVAANRAGGETRRTFLKLMGASVALAGAATIPGCRRPDHKILTYSREIPEEVIAGKPLYYATSMPRPDGGAEGLLVETHEGRPTKLEGNPLHPVNRGKCSTWALASILSLYDPDRLKFPMYDNPARGRVEATLDDFRTWAKVQFKSHASGLNAGTSTGTGPSTGTEAEAAGDRGKGLAFIADKYDSTTREAVVAKVMKQWPEATWVWWDPMHASAAIKGTEMAFGTAMHELLDISKANTRLVVSLDRDFLVREGGEVSHARMFAAARMAPAPIKDASKRDPNDQMVRLYAIEHGHSATGAMADHRLRLSPSRVTAFAVELAKFVLPKLGDPASQALATAIAGANTTGAEIDRAFLEACAKDLLDAANRGKSLIVAGPTQPAIVHALAAALNGALGNIGASVRYTPMSSCTKASSFEQLSKLTDAMQSGTIRTLVCLNTNPMYDAPGDMGFAEAFAKVPATITLSVQASETAAASTWALNGAHTLESWGDTRAMDGTIAPIQPMIAPLYAPAASEVELLTMLMSNDLTSKADGYEIVRGVWREIFGSVGFDKTWRRALHDGIIPSTTTRGEAPKVKFADVATRLADMTLPAAPTKAAIEAVVAIGQVHDGRYANNAWLQELPDHGTRVAWDNPAMMSPATAMELGVEPESYSKKSPNDIYTKQAYPAGRMAKFAVEGRTIEAAVWILPGMADNTVILTAGYGRQKTGVVADGVGFNVYPIRSKDSTTTMLSGVAVSAMDDFHLIASTQNHWTMEGRTSIVRAVDVEGWHRHGAEVKKWVDWKYNTSGDLNFAERLGELNYTPPNISIYQNPYNRSNADPDMNAKDPSKLDYQGKPSQANFSVSPQWGMTIDQNTCTGCGACTIACQSENNIPVVGKKEVMKGREMAWIRVDRYFTGSDLNNPEQMLHQPVACVHCENAPCEVVCPVNATVHGPEGHNYMTYNRCIGTRYCANNCPYKVRRFNFFDYGVTKFNGGYYGKDLLESVMPDRDGITGSGEHNKINPNLIPPRLRAKLDEISRMKMNPNVTVRSRGLMEKCSYCIQRSNAAKIECKIHDLYGKNGVAVPDGFFQTACQQACPSNSIVFGDILDPVSKVYATRKDARSYGLLNYLNTRPRTSHMVKLFNPNPELCNESRKHGWDDPFYGSHSKSYKGDAQEGGGQEGGGLSDQMDGSVGSDPHGADPQGSLPRGSDLRGSDPRGSDPHGADKALSPAAFKFMPSKRRQDSGYLGSLGVLTASAHSVSAHSAPAHAPTPTEVLSLAGQSRRGVLASAAHSLIKTNAGSPLGIIGDLA